MVVTIILIVAIFLNVSLSIFVLTQNPRAVINRLFSLLGILASIWTFTNYMTTVSSSVYWLDSTYASGALVLSIGLIWILKLTDGTLNWKKVCSILTVGILLCSLSFKSGFIVNSYSKVSLGAVFPNGSGWGLVVFMIVYLYFSFLMLWKLYAAEQHSNSKEEITQLKIIRSGITVSLIITASSSFILPLFSIFLFAGIDSIGFLIFLTLVAYSITRHHLFNIHVAAVQLITFTIWVFILIRILLATSIHEIVIETILLIVMIVFGSLLISATLKEIRQRKEIQKLADKLNTANTNLKDLNLHLSEKVAEQTKEIRGAYDLEKEARRELEKLNEAKNQFIMITQHHLRTPVTSIEWELESMLGGAYGAVTDEFKSALRDTQTATKRLTRIIDDFLNITAMKTGQNILTLSHASLKPAIEDIIAELKTELTRRRITLSYPHDEVSWPVLSIDSPKMHDILLIIVENAIKYNHDGGSVTISARHTFSMFELVIENTGIGITHEEIGKIGSALFYRGNDARKINTVGMGVGLSVAKAIIKAHHGTFAIHSDGKDKGAKITIELPTIVA